MRKSLFYMVNLVWFVTGSFLLYYLLVEDNRLHLTITDIFYGWTDHHTKLGHIFIVGFLPIYLGLIIFGAAILVIYLRANAWPTFFQYLKRCLHIDRK